MYREDLTEEKSVSEAKLKVYCIGGEGIIGKRYRLIFEHEGRLKYLLAFQMCKDGSLMVWDKLPRQGAARVGDLSLAQAGVQKVYYKDMEEMHFGASDCPGKVTFHMSGAINTDSKNRTVGAGLRALDMTRQLCVIGFPHVSELHEETRARDGTDFVFSFPVSDDTHLKATVLISPPSGIALDYFINVSDMVCFELEFEGDLIEHPEKKLVAHILLGELGRGSVKSAGFRLLPTLAPHLAPDRLKSKRD